MKHVKGKIIMFIIWEKIFVITFRWKNLSFCKVMPIIYNILDAFFTSFNTIGKYHG